MSKVKIAVRSLYDYDWKQASREAQLHCKDPSLAKQSFREESDINEIVRRFGLTGKLPDVVHEPQYGDYSEVFDFQTAMNAVRTAQEGFDALPAHIRARFHNDPQELLVFVTNDENRPEAEKLGLVKKPDTLPDAAPAATTKGAPDEAGTGKGTKGDAQK